MLYHGIKLQVSLYLMEHVYGSPDKNKKPFMKNNNNHPILFFVILIAAFSLCLTTKRWVFAISSSIIILRAIFFIKNGIAQIVLKDNYAKISQKSKIKVLSFNLILVGILMIVGVIIIFFLREQFL